MEVLRGSRQSVFLARPLSPRSESACFTILGPVDRRGSENYIFFFGRRDRARESCAHNPPVNSWLACLLLLRCAILSQPIGATWGGLLPPM